MTKEILCIFVILISWMLNAAMDAIDHAKGSLYLFEFWHILKAISYGMLIISIVMLAEFHFLTIIITFFFIALSWDIMYKYFRKKHLEKLDDKIKIPWLCKLWGIDRRD